MRVFGLWQAEELLQNHLPRRSESKVVSAHHLVHALVGIIDDDGERVGDGSVAALEHEIVDVAGDGSQHSVGKRPPGPLREADPQRRCAGPHRLSSRGSFGIGTVSAGAGVGTRRSVRRLRGGENIFPRTGALIDQASVSKLLKRGLVSRISVSLCDDRTVPVKAERGKVLELLLRCAGVAVPVEVFDPHDESSSARSSRGPCDECGAKVPKMQIPGGAGCVPPRSDNGGTAIDPMRGRRVRIHGDQANDEVTSSSATGPPSSSIS